MEKYINAKELKEKILDSCFLPDWAQTLVNRVIDDMLAADVVPAIHAHWEDQIVFEGFSECGESHIENICSNCGKPYTGNDDECIYCHAIMDEEEEEKIHAQWVDKTFSNGAVKYTQLVCSNCGEPFYYGDNEEECSNCGAIMEKED